MRALEKYLASHAEPEARIAERLSRFDQVIAVPAYGEDVRSIQTIARASGAALVIVVVNAHDASPPEFHAANAATLAALSAGAEPLTPRAWLHDHLLVIDRASVPSLLPRKQAVGLARKIGGDIACALFAAGKLRSRWLHMTDCDVELPEDYLAAAAAERDAVLLTYPFRHVAGGEPAMDEAHGIYEAFLRYYVLGLRSARSPWAMHTIGSTLAVDLHRYAEARGVPKRDAAEDFYLVSKIAKLGPARVPRSAPILIRARRSNRVPFGTGRSTAAIAAAGTHALYHPAIFAALGAWLRALESWASEPTPTPPTAHLAPDTPALLALRRALASMDVDAALPRALAPAPLDPAARRARAHTFFDAFRTRKLVHLLRDAGLGTLPWRDALASSPFTHAVDATASPAAISAALATLESAH